MVDDLQMAAEGRCSREDLAAWLTDRDLIDRSVHDPWIAHVRDDYPGTAQQECASSPELSDLPRSAAASSSVVRSKNVRQSERGDTHE